VLLISGDDALWPQIGPHVGGDLVLKQVDSIDELLTATASGQPAVVLWDARNQADAAGALSRLQLHSPRLAVVALDEASGAQTWTNPIALRQVVAHVTMPIQAAQFTAALESAQEEVNARMALLGDGSAAATGTAAPAAGSPGAPAGPRSIPWLPASLIAGHCTGMKKQRLSLQSRGNLNSSWALAQRSPISRPSPYHQPARRCTNCSRA